MDALTLDEFNRNIDAIARISDELMDGWVIHCKQDIENGRYLVKKSSAILNGTQINYEYHVVYHLSYSVPIICFNVWRLDGSLVSMEDYWKLNTTFEDSNLLNSLTQLDHPVLCRPFLTLHPCKTQEIIAPFLTGSKNPVISWLSVMGPFVHLQMLGEYFKHC